MTIANRIVSFFVGAPRVLPESSSQKDPVGCVARACLLCSSRESANLNAYREQISFLIDTKIGEFEEGKIPLIETLVDEILTEVRTLHVKEEFASERGISKWESKIIETLFESGKDLRTIQLLRQLNQSLRPYTFYRRSIELERYFISDNTKTTKVKFSNVATVHGDLKETLVAANFSSRIRSNKEIRQDGGVSRRSRLDGLFLRNQVTSYTTIKSPEETIHEKFNDAIVLNVQQFFVKAEDSVKKEQSRSFFKESKALIQDSAEMILDLVGEGKSDLEICQALKEKIQADNKEVYTLDLEEFKLSAVEVVDGRESLLPKTKLPLRLSKYPDFPSVAAYWQRGYWQEGEEIEFVYLHLEDDELNLVLSAVDTLFLDQTVLSLINVHRNTVRPF